MRAICVLALLLSLPACSLAAEVVVFGDSWGTEGKRAFQNMFDKRGVKVTINNAAVGGTTAAGWARQPDSLKKEMAADTKHVWLTIGGNDAQADLPGCGTKCIPKCINETLANSKVFLDPAFAAFPDANVVQFGYDILIFNHFPTCGIKGLLLMPDCKGQTTCVNTNFRHLQTDYVNQLGSYGGYKNHVPIDIAGAMQKAGGVAGADVGKPVLSQYSPYKFMQSNCIHANDEGFGHVFDAMWDRYWSKYYNATK